MVDRIKATGRSAGASFVQLYKSVLMSPNYIMLKPNAVKLLVDLLSQYSGFNNGDLCASMTLMRKRGWNSNSSLASALEQLIYYGFVKKSRQGGKHRPTLLAVTFYSVDECKGKLEEIRPTRVPTHDYKVTKRNLKKITKLEPRIW